MKFTKLQEASKELTYRVKLFDENNKLVKIETSTLKSNEGVFKKYANYLKGFNFASAGNMFSYLTNDEKTGCAYTLNLYDKNDNKVDSMKFSDYLKKYYDVNAIYEMLKKYFSNEWEREHYGDKVKKNAEIVKKSKMFKELFGSRIGDVLTESKGMKFRKIDEDDFTKKLEQKLKIYDIWTEDSDRYWYFDDKLTHKLKVIVGPVEGDITEVKDFSNLIHLKDINIGYDKKSSAKIVKELNDQIDNFAVELKRAVQAVVRYG